MATKGYETVLKIQKASFQQGKKPISAIKHGKAKPGDDHMPGGFLVGNQGMDFTLYVKPGWTIKTETFIDQTGPAIRVWTEKA